MNRPSPQTFPTNGPTASQFTAYDPDRMSGSGNDLRGFGATEQEALSDFWQQWEEKVLGPMAATNHEISAGTR